MSVRLFIAREEVVSVVGLIVRILVGKPSEGLGIIEDIFKE